MAGEFSKIYRNLDEVINDDNKVVTYKWLSRDIGVHVNIAKKILYHYVQKQLEEGTSLNLTYLVAGIQKLKDGNKVHRFVVVPEKNLEAFKAKFLTVTSIHLYSVQLGVLKDDVPLYDIDLLETVENEKFQRCSSIQNNNIQIVKKAFKFADNTSQAIKTSITKKEKDIPAKPKVNNLFDNFSKNKKSVKRKCEDENADNSSKPCGNKNEPEAKKPNIKDAGKKSKNNVPPATSFFAKQEALPLKKPVEQKLSVLNDEKLKKSSKESTKQTKSESRNNDKNKLKLKKGRRRIHVVSSSSSSENSDESEEESDTKATKTKNDIFLETQSSESEELDDAKSEDQKLPSDKSSEVNSEKRKGVYKTVTKTFQDDDGFMVTKKVKEYVEEDSDDNGNENTETSQQPIKHSPVKNLISAAPKSKPVVKKQVSLTSFFGKK